jgi:PTS system mannitol-specific IIA component
MERIAMVELTRDKIKLHVQVNDKYEAIRMVGQMLVDSGHVPTAYIDFMIMREDSLSTYMGAGLAIPHGTNEAKQLVVSSGLALLTVPEGVTFGDGQLAHLIVGIAAIGDDHLDLLTNIATIVSDEETNARIIQSSSMDEVLAIFSEGA